MASTPKNIKIPAADRDHMNAFLIRFLEGITQNGMGEVEKLRSKLAISYYTLLILSVVMFAVGIALLTSSMFTSMNTDSGRDLGAAGIAGGLGVVDLLSLFILRPVQRIQGLMGDMSQITLAINSYQTQVGLRLLEADSDDSSTLGEAADHINKAAQESIGLIQVYFEARSKTDKNKNPAIETSA